MAHNNHDYEEIDLRTPWGRFVNTVKDSINAYLTEERKERIIPTLYVVAGFVGGYVMVKSMCAILWLAHSIGLPL